VRRLKKKKKKKKKKKREMAEPVGPETNLLVGKKKRLCPEVEVM
jgi:hypothetical protein